MSATAAINVPMPLFTSTDHRIDCVVEDSTTDSGRHDITGEVIKLLIVDPGGTTYSYTLTHGTEAEGEGYFTLTGSNHTTAGSASSQIQIDGIPKGEYTLTFRAILVAS